MRRELVGGACKVCMVTIGENWVVPEVVGKVSRELRRKKVCVGEITSHGGMKGGRP